MRRILIVLALTVFLLAFRNPAVAREIRQGDQCVIGANETIQGNLYALCRTLDIKGRVQGNVFAAATNATLTGTVEGDVYLLAGQLDVAGVIRDNLHFAGVSLRLLPTADFSGENADVISLSLSTTIDEAVFIPGNITGLGYQLVLDGTVGGEVSFWGSALTLEGSVGRDVDATVGDPQLTGVSQLQGVLDLLAWEVDLVNPGLVLSESAIIEGNLSYTGPAAGRLEGTINGGTVFSQIINQPDLTQIILQEEGGGLGVFLTQVIREFLILALIGIIGLVFLPQQFQAPIRSIQSRSLPSLAMGLLSFIVAFPVALILLILILFLIVVLLLLQFDGLAVALSGGTLIGMWAGGVSLFFLVAIFVSRVIVCLVIGRGIVRAVIGDDGSSRITYLSLLVGILLLALLVSLPSVGIIISAIMTFLGLGAILNALLIQLQTYRDRLYGPPSRLMPTPPMRRGEVARRLPPPMIDDYPTPPGLDNLPEGFEWWDEDSEES